MTSLNGASSSDNPQSFLPSAQFFEHIFPGFSVISSAFQELLHRDWNSYAGIVGVCSVAVFLSGFAYGHVLDLAKTWLVRTAHFSQYDEAYDMITIWASKQKRAQSTLVKIRDERDMYFSDHKTGTQKKPLRYFPWKGKFYFWYHYRLFTYQSMIEEGQWSQREDVSISCFDTSSRNLDQFLQERREEHLKFVEQRTPVFENHGSEWRSVTSKRVRPLDTVIIPRQAKQNILSSIDDFIDPTAQQWYSDHGQPYRKGLLFHGPPGTGKTSLGLSIAGYCDLDLYIVHLSSICDQDLSQLLGTLPSRCVVLLEDIDAVKSAADRGQKPAVRQYVQNPSNELRGLSLSGLLNALDGVTSPEGCITIMTTNRFKSLDPAVIRAGRADVKIELGLVDKTMATELFSLAYRDFNSITASRYEKLAAAFAEQVPDLRLNAADIMSFLKAHRTAPEQASKGLRAWLEQNQHSKEG